MGGQLSKKPSSEITDLEYETELVSYEAECRVDPVLKSFDSKVHSRTDHMINTLAAGVEVRALSIDSLKEVTQCLLDMNQEVVKVILECKDDVWNHQELFDLVNDYLENSLEILQFCDSLEKCLKQARNNQLLILFALELFNETTENKYDRTLEELRNFKAAGSPFTQEFFETFRSVYSHQITMLQKLKIKKNKLDKKLKFIRSWRKISNVMFVSIFASILICSVVAAAVAAPPVAAALAAAASIPLGSMGKWIDSLFKNFENALKGQKEAVNAMTTGGYVAIKDLENIRVLIDRLEIEIESTVAAAEFAGTSEEEEGLKIAAVEIKKRVDVFMKIVEELGVQARSCGQDIHRARTVVLQRIIKPPIH